MTVPTLKVEIAFNAGFSTPAASRTWTDITQYVLLGPGVEIGYGRQDELSLTGPNTLRRITLNNSDGRFTAERASSPYYPNVKVGRPIRVTCTPEGQSVSVRYLGYILEWPVDWDAVVVTVAIAPITAASRLARLSNGTALGNVIYEEFRRDAPVAHYMLNNLSDSVAGGPALFQAGSGTAVAFTGTGPGTDGIQAAVFSAAGKYLSSPNLTVTINTYECFFLGGAQASIKGIIAVRNAAGDTLAVTTDATGALFLTSIINDVETSESVAGSSGVMDGNTHHLVWQVTTGAVYLDGTLIDAANTKTMSNALSIKVGHSVNSHYGVVVGTIAHAAIYSALPGSTRIADHAAVGLNTYHGETAEARLDRYAAYAGVAAAEISSDAGADTPMAHIDTTGKTPLELLRKVEETDGGLLFDGRDGTLTYLARTARYATNTVLDLNVAIGEVQPGYVPKLDTSAVINEVVATIADGSDPQETVPAKHQASYDEHGPYKRDIELSTTNADEAFQAAWWRVNTFGEPSSRVAVLAVELTKMTAARQATVMSVQIGNKISVSNLPSQSDAASKRFLVEGYTEIIGNASHLIVFNVSPAAGFDVWTVEDSVFGAIDENPLAY